MTKLFISATKYTPDGSLRIDWSKPFDLDVIRREESFEVFNAGNTTSSVVGTNV